MSLKISNRATAKQIALLEKLEYQGQGKYAASQLTVEEAIKIIDELFSQQQWKYSDIDEIAHDYYNNPEQSYGSSFNEREGDM